MTRSHVRVVLGSGKSARVSILNQTKSKYVTTLTYT